jgi:protein involved in polysaccharide export with SLBB domain
MIIRMMLKKIFFLLLITLAYNTIAQDVSTTVNTMSDTQLKDAVKKAEQQGYSQSQVEAMARAKGLSATEIATLRDRIQKLKEQNGSSTIDEATLREDLAEFDLELGDEELLDNDLIRGELRGRVFGSELFTNRKLNFAPSVNIPTPMSYVLGPGDQVVIDIWGASEKTYQLEVGPEGSVKIPNIGPVYVSGLDMESASKKLLGRLKQIYAGLDVNTYAQVSLGQIRSIKVNIIGEAATPGTYTISSLSTVLHALYQCGGINGRGSYRNIEVFRGGKKINTFDLYDFLIEGKIESNIMLEDQDIVRVPVYTKRVQIKGEVKKSGIYELEEGEMLSHLIDFSGGFTDEAYTKLVTIKRKTPSAKKILTIKSENFDQFEMISGDQIDVSEILDIFENRVSIRGAIWRPGEYELTDSLTLFELIQKAEGITSDAFMPRGHILRYNDDLSFRNIEFSVSDVITGGFDVLLEEEDEVTIKSSFDMKDQYFVRVTGEVRNPRSIAYQDSLTVEDVVFMAGGFKEAAYKSIVEVARKTSEDNTTNQSLSSVIFRFEINQGLFVDANASKFQLEPYDIVTIRRSPFFNKLETIELEGEVQFPGMYVMNFKDERISDLIKRAGGFTKESFPAGGTLIRETEYFDEAKAAQVKKLRILGLGSIDSTATKGTFAINRNEAIAIKLEDIMRNPGSEIDLILKEGDIISIPKMLQTVRVRGEVYFSSNLIFDKDLNFRNYVSMAGGGTERSKMKKSYIVYPNGSAGRTNSFLWFKNFPEVEPGSEIIVPAKAEKRKMSPQEVIGITTGVATLGLLTNQIINAFSK